MSHDASTDAEIAAKFWKALKADRTLMLGLSGEGGGDSQPMTAQLDGDLDDYVDGGPIYIFTAKSTDLARAMGGRHAAAVQFAAKGHDLFATLAGEVRTVDDRPVIDRLWNPFVAAWFKGGKDDPDLQLIRFDARSAQIWLNENSLFSGVKLLLGGDPKQDYKDKKAELRLG
jgi:general stress protein 26